MGVACEEEGPEREKSAFVGGGVRSCALLILTGSG